MELINKPSIILYIYFKNSNIICTITDVKGRTLVWITAGSNKLKGTKKITVTTISLLLKFLCGYIKKQSLSTVYIKIRGTNKLKTNFIKYLKILGFNILFVQEKLCLPYGGCKQPRIRRL